MVTAIFAADGSLAGSNTCNEYNTTFEAGGNADGILGGTSGSNTHAVPYVAKDGQLSLQLVAFTQMSYASDMGPERVFLAVLNTTKTYQVTG